MFRLSSCRLCMKDAEVSEGTGYTPGSEFDVTELVAEADSSWFKHCWKNWKAKFYNFKASPSIGNEYLKEEQCEKYEKDERQRRELEECQKFDGAEFRKRKGEQYRTDYKQTMSQYIELPVLRKSPKLVSKSVSSRVSPEEIARRCSTSIEGKNGNVAIEGHPTQCREKSKWYRSRH